MSSVYPIVSAEAAQKLNEKVQKQINSHLFLFCNYEPTTYLGTSEDAKFLIAIQDLYKFAIDTSAVIDRYWSYLPKECKQFRGLKKILEQVKMLRTQYSHNQSDADGFVAREQLECYSKWIMEAIHKTEPESEEDYAAMNQKLQEMSEALLRQLNQFVDYVSNAPNKQELVQKWKDGILYWYTHNTKTRYYQSQLMDAYIARAVAKGKDYPALHRQKSLNWKVNRWIEDAFYYPIDSKIEEFQGTKRETEALLSGAENNPFRTMMTDENFAAYEKALQERIAEAQAEIEKLAQERGELEKKLDGKPREYFFCHLEEELRITMDHLDKKKETYTLLPQDLMQEDIERRFSRIPSPDCDF